MPSSIEKSTAHPSPEPTCGTRQAAPGAPASGEFDLLKDLEIQLHAAWDLGANVILCWHALPDAIELLRVPHYAVAAETEPRGAMSGTGRTPMLIRELISGRRELAPEAFERTARALGVTPLRLRLLRPPQDAVRERDAIECLIRRYSISFVASRAVALFDIVGFGLLSSFEQMVQLNSLSRSINAAQHCMQDRRIGFNFARSITGDGYYLWNRDRRQTADTDLYHFMHLVLADNAIARRNSHANSVPLLRAGFHIGACYEFYQVEGLQPTPYDCIVGDVTIDLARLMERALPGQIVVGEFQQAGVRHDIQDATADPIRFMRAAQHALARLDGLELGGERIASIKCYLTGAALADGNYGVRRLTLVDKHGLARNAFNAKVNIYRDNAEPIFLGLEDRTIAANPLAEQSVMLPPDGAPRTGKRQHPARATAR